MSAADGIAQVNELATQTVSTAWNSASAFLIVLVLAGALFVFAYYIGRGQLVALLLAFYAAYAIYIAFPYESLLPQSPAMTALISHAAVYGALTLLFYIILRRVVVSDFLYVGLIGLLILSFLGAAFLMALAFHVFPVSTLYEFSPAISMLFGPDKFFFWWFVAPAIGLFFLAH